MIDAQASGNPNLAQMPNDENWPVVEGLIYTDDALVIRKLVRMDGTSTPRQISG